MGIMIQLRILDELNSIPLVMVRRKCLVMEHQLDFQSQQVKLKKKHCRHILGEDVVTSWLRFQH